MKKQFISNIPNILYGVAVCMLILGILNIYSTYQYISSLVYAGQLDISQQLLKVIITYIESFIHYVFYAATLGCFALLIQMLKKKHDTTEHVVVKERDEDQITDSEVDEYLATL